ncbi:acyl-CoA dehydrogenase [Sphaerisporangium melleum]|uniref:Acyl-CoA dehydrogenase n=1 Tax=Sphaerisporangium melleum TaxID=321316 RepID=A0A917QVF9_9ACTN|nr:acyl-CoA dehydrogenase family protein [Sphaerisporangium melleum]GGK71433.1 acyl-CoA dehydrogenase [Sphaerisporangium melleum]GII70174.1 acyl-CoA dehydrogenase [Sphaerisporangium melleum]
MDFDLDETQAELKELAVGLFTREAGYERLAAHDRSGRPYDAELWRAVARAGLIGACLPEQAGGAGLGAVGTAVLARESGARTAPIPLQESLIAGLVVGGYGSPDQRALLARLAEGEIVLTAALAEPGRDLGAPPRTRAVPGGDGGWTLSGRTAAVGYAAESAAIVVPALTAGDGIGLFLVAPGDASLHPVSTATGEPAAALTLDGAPGEPLGAPDGTAFTALRLLATAAVTASASGVLAGALALTTEHIRKRRQFDRALAEFQAVTVQIADVYIAGRALDVAVWSGAWRIDQGLDEEAELDLAVAAHTVTDSALAALYTCQHLHGGLGLDVTYPLHRHFARGKRLAHLLGGVEARLDTMGALVR